ncbi:MAG: hypothetical protein IH851_03995 [Armatimonadetes bacterium]|nr:hypothetical protein [Armatimonadota bacterium]
MTTFAAVVYLCACGLAPAQGQGHEIRYPLEEGTVEYRFRGGVVRSYYGSVDAPVRRRADVSGVFTVKTERADGEWVVVGRAREAKVTLDGRPASAEVAAAVAAGVWRRAVKGGEAVYSVDGSPAVPSALNAPLWPLGWAPLVPKRSLRIGDEVVVTFHMPVQAFLEDDPIGSLEVPVRLLFVGPERQPYGSVQAFRFQTEFSVNKKIRHPEGPNLTLRGTVRILGDLKVSRRDGRIEESTVLMTVSLRLEGPEYEFGFSKSDASIAAHFERVR